MCPLTSKSCVVAAAVRPQSFLKKVIPRGCIFKTCAILAPLEVYMVSFPSRPNLRPVARHLAGEASRPARLCPGSQSMFVHVKKSVNQGSIKAKNPSNQGRSRQTRYFMPTGNHINNLAFSLRVKSPAIKANQASSRQIKKQRTSHGRAPLPPALDVGRSMLSVGCLPFPQQSRQIKANQGKSRQIKATDVFLLAAPSTD